MRGQVVSGVKKLSDGEPLKGYEFGYQFDGIGNRIETVTNGRTETYTANTLNQYTQREIASAFDVVGEADPMASVDINGPVSRQGKYFSKQVGVNNTTQSVYQPVDVSVNGNPEPQKHKFVAKDPELFAYDDDGNLTSDGRWTYAWDGENRLVGMESHSTVAAAAKSKITYAYDYMGRRIAKISQSWNSGTSSWNSAPIRTYLYDGWNLIGEVEDSYTWVGKYVWGLDIAGSMTQTGGVGALLEIWNNWEIFNPIADANGNIIKIVSHAYLPEVVGQYEYGPFGEPVRVTGTAAEVNPFRFSSKYQEAESGLLYYGYRFYDASTGRWINRDPIAESVGRNIYSFVDNDPRNKIDYLGLLELKWPPKWPKFPPEKNKKIIETVLIKRDKVNFLAILKEAAGKDSEDGYGHWWTEINLINGGYTESYGWWPIKEVSVKEALIGVQGELNGQTTFEGTPTTDPYHNAPAEESWHPALASNGSLEYGNESGKKCCKATSAGIDDCIRNFASSFSGMWKLFPGPNCHTFQKDLMKSCCLVKP